MTYVFFPQQCSFDPPWCTFSNIWQYLSIFWQYLLTEIIWKPSEIQTFKAKLLCTHHVLSLYFYIIFNNYYILNHTALIKNSGNVVYEDSSIINSLYDYWKWFELVLIKSNAVNCIYRLTFCSALKWGGMNGFEFSSSASNRKRHRK